MNKSLHQSLKEVSLLVAGALLGITMIAFEDIISRNLISILIPTVFLVLYGTGFLDWLFELLYQFVRRINQKCGIICIYAPYEINSKNTSWVDVNLKEFKEIFKDKNIKYRIGKSERVFKEYPVIINPYGGAYPEKNFSNFQSLEKIFNFVRKGGTYINIADIPFYYAYDKNLSRKVDTTPLAGDFSFERSFLKTILTKKLNHYVLGVTKGKDFDLGVERIIQLSETSENLYEKESFEDGPRGGYSPILKIPYGKGFFVFSTLRIKKDNLQKNLIKLIKSSPNG